MEFSQSRKVPRPPVIADVEGYEEIWGSCCGWNVSTTQLASNGECLKLRLHRAVCGSHVTRRWHLATREFAG